MKLVALGDTHFGLKFGRKDAHDKSIRRMFSAFKNAVDAAKKAKADYIIHCGDVFDRSSPKPEIQSRAMNLFESALEDGIGVIIIPGNHDKGYLNNSLLEYYYPNFHLVNKPENIELDEISIFGVPYSRSVELDNIYRKCVGNTIIACHETFQGAEVGPQRYKFAQGLNASLPNNIPFIVSGHIHRSQAVQDNRALYTGSTERTSFQEVIEPKGYLEITVEKDLIDVAFQELSSERMEVIEVGINEIADIDVKPDIPTLVRVVNFKMTWKIHAKIRSMFPPENYPLLWVSPREGRKLSPLYFRPPEFNPVHLSFSL